MTAAPSYTEAEQLAVIERMRKAARLGIIGWWTPVDVDGALYFELGTARMSCEDFDFYLAKQVRMARAK